MRYGADARDDYGLTALHIATVEGHANVVSVLLHHGADLRTEVDGLLAIKSQVGKTALQLADDPNVINILQAYEALFSR
jgi:ankyrin repeat protein